MHLGRGSPQKWGKQGKRTHTHGSIPRAQSLSSRERGGCQQLRETLMSNINAFFTRISTKMKLILCDSIKNVSYEGVLEKKYFLQKAKVHIIDFLPMLIIVSLQGKKHKERPDLITIQRAQIDNRLLGPSDPHPKKLMPCLGWD